MIFFSDNLCYINFFSEMYYHVFSTKADQKGGSIHRKKNLSTEIHILITSQQLLRILLFLFSDLDFNASQSGI